MSVSVIIPAYNEQEWLNQTIQNIFDTAGRTIEVIVVLNGNWQPVDPRAKVIRNKDNEGERVAMNQAAKVATGTHLFRIDAHCDFSPIGWDVMMEEVTGPRDMTQAVLTACRIRWSMLKKEDQERWLASGKAESDWHEWERIPGHRYERCRLLPNFEARWEDPNKTESGKPPPWGCTLPNMSSTGCGFMIRKKFYELIGGADESYPIMGAIGEEFSVKTWMNGGKVQTRTDVILGHIFNTGGYDTGGVIETRKRLVETWGHRYGEIREKFDDFNWSKDVRPTAIQPDGPRTVTVDREDTTITKDSDGNVIRKETRHFRHIWVDDKTESDLTDDQIRIKYAPGAAFMGKKVLLRNDAGEMIDGETGEIPADGPESRQPVDK